MDADVLIVGGGLNGPALALGLARGGLSSVVIDARQPPVDRGEVWLSTGALTPCRLASQRLLAAPLGSGQGLTAQPILKVVAS